MEDRSYIKALSRIVGLLQLEMDKGQKCEDIEGEGMLPRQVKSLLHQDVGIGPTAYEK